MNGLADCILSVQLVLIAKQFSLYGTFCGSTKSPLQIQCGSIGRVGIPSLVSSDRLCPKAGLVLFILRFWKSLSDSFRNPGPHEHARHLRVSALGVAVNLFLYSRFRQEEGGGGGREKNGKRVILHPFT